MRAASSGLLSLLSSTNRFRIADLYQITLATGDVIRWTSHTSDLTWDGHTWSSSGPAITRGLVRHASGLEVSTLDVTLGIGRRSTVGIVQIGSYPLPFAALLGVLDGAGFVLYRVFMPADGDTSLGAINWFEGTISTAIPSSSGVKLTVKSWLDRLNTTLPRIVYQPGCNHALYDSGCGAVRDPISVYVDPDGEDPGNLVINMNGAYAADYFKLGTLTLRGIVRTIAGHTEANAGNWNRSLVKLAVPFPFQASEEDGTILLGCDKTLSICRNRFDKTERFTGFPFIPNPNAGKPIQYGPKAAQTSGYGKPLPVVFGRARVPGTYVWQAPGSLKDDHREAKVALAICQGEGTIRGVWRDNGQTYFASLAACDNLGHAVNFALKGGAVAQAPWSGYTDVNGDLQTPEEWRFYGPVTIPGSLQVTIPDLAFGRLSNVYEWGPDVVIGPNQGGFAYYSLSGQTPGSRTIVFNNVLAIGKSVLLEYATARVTLPAPGYGGVLYVITDHLCVSKTEPQYPEWTFEVRGQFDDGVTGQVSPADVLATILTDGAWGLGWSSARVIVATGQDGTAASSLTRYADQASYKVAVALTEQKAARDHLREILDACNAEAVWSAGKLRFVPLGDTAIGTYTPVVGTGSGGLLQVTENDLIVPDPTADPLEIERTAQEETFNACPVEFLDGSIANVTAALQPATVEDVESGDVETSGGTIRRASVLSLHAIIDRGQAQRISRLRAQRSCYVRNRYRFRLGWQHCLLEPLDLLKLQVPSIGLTDGAERVVRIRSIDEDDSGALLIEAEDWPFGVGSAVTWTTQSGDETGGPTGSADPFNVGEPAVSLLPIGYAGRPVLAVGAFGPARDWAGAEVWISWDAGTTYYKAGETAGACYGILADSMTAVTGQDSTNTLKPDLAVSHGEISADSVTRRGGGGKNLGGTSILALVGGELVGWASYALDSGNVYNLTTLSRGMYQSPVGAHPTGTPFLLIDELNPERLCLIPFDPTLYGSTVRVKLLSFNAARSRVQALADVTAYSFTIPATSGAVTWINRDNLIPNPSSEAGPPAGADGTDPAWSGRVLLGAGAYAGQWAREVSGPGASVVLGVASALPTDRFYFAGRLKAETAGANKGVKLRISGRDKDGVEVCGTSSTEVDAAAWTSAEVFSDMVANVVSVAFLLLAGSDAAAHGYADALLARSRIDDKVLVPGAVQDAAARDGGLTTAAIATDAIEAAQIADGAVTAPAILAGAIVAKSLTLANWDNLWPNATSEQAPPDGADLSAAEWAQRINLGAGAYSGSWARHVYGDPGDPGSFLYHSVPASPGEKFYMEARIQAEPGGYDPGGITIVALDKDGAEIGGRTSVYGAGGWAKASAQYECPAGTCRVQFGLNTGDPSEHMYVDAIYCRRMADANLIVDGAITADKIEADALLTPNYAEYTDGIPSAGAKMDKDGDALKVAFGSVKLGYRARLKYSGTYPSGTCQLETGAVGISSWELYTGGSGSRKAKVNFAHPLANDQYVVISEWTIGNGMRSITSAKATGYAVIQAIAAGGAFGDVDAQMGDNQYFLDVAILKLW